MLDPEYELKGICRRNRDGSRMTQAQREQRLRQVARDLERLGYKHLRASSLKPKHVQTLVAHWQDKQLSQGTIKTGWPTCVGGPRKPASTPPSRTQTTTTASTAAGMSPTTAKPANSPQTLARVTSEHVAMSLRLQAAFGLRREETIKHLSFADQGDHLALKSSWCKAVAG